MAINENLIPIPGRLHSVATEGHVAGADEIYDDTQQKNQATINSKLIEAVGTGGSVDTRISNAVNVEKTRAEGAESTLDSKITAEQTRAASTENALDNRVGTLEEAVGTGGSVDSRITSAVATEISRAQEAESTLQSGITTEVTRAQGAENELDNRVTTNKSNIEALQEAYRAITQSQPIPKTSEEWAAMTSWEEGVVYRVQGTTSYADYMYNGTTIIKMAEYDNAIDNEPTAGSDNLVKSDGINSLLLNNFFIGEGNTFKKIKILGIQPNHRYRIVLSKNDWDMSGIVTSSVFKFEIESVYNNTSTHLAGTYVGQNVPLYYDITTPQQCDYITIGGRAASGVHVRFIIVDSESETTDVVLFDKKTQVYITENGDLIIKSVGTKLYFKGTTQWALRGTLNSTYSNSQLAEAMNVSLVDLSETDTGYIELPDEYSFIIDGATNLPAIKHRYAISIKDLVLLSCLSGQIVALNLGVFGYQYIESKFDDITAINNRNTFKSKVQFYNNESGYPIIKKVGTSLYFKSSTVWAGRVAFNLNYTNAELASAMGVDLVDLSDSDKGYIELPDDHSFVITSSGPTIKSRYDVTHTDVVLLANVGGYIKGISTDVFGYPFIEHIISGLDTRITALENEDTNISPLVTENTDVLIPQIRGHQTSKSITLAFLTDLHNEAYTSIYNPNNNVIAKIKRMVQGINIINKDIKLWVTLIGGDYLLNNDTTVKSNALKALIDVTVSLNGINNLPKLMIKGNHDDNSMGTVADAINSEEFYDNSAKLFEENEIIIDSNNPSGCYGYFDIKPQKIRIIFLNSVDIPWIVENDTLKYKGQWTKGIQQAQLDFVKNALTFTETGWGVIFVSHHGVTEVSGYSTGGDDYITPGNGGSQLWGIIKAFKNKTVFNGTITGDFASSVNVDYSNNSSNSVICLINGHTHSDRNGVKDGMLFLSTTTATQSNVDTNTDGSSYTPIENTKNEAAMDFITVDKLSGIIYLDRYGFGVSRKFYYTGDDIGEIPT